MILQLLTATGWWPGCSAPDVIGVGKASPPQRGDYDQIIIGISDAMGWVPTPEGGGGSALSPRMGISCVIDVEVATFYDGGWGFPCSYL